MVADFSHHVLRFLSPNSETTFFIIIIIFLAKTNGSDQHVEYFIHLEVLNVILASRELGERYLLPESEIKQLFINFGEPFYFGVFSCLFYIQNSRQYSEIRDVIISKADNILSYLSDIRMNSEKTYL
jgi:hypothetical protein